MSDWLTAFDDMLVERPRFCVMCGREAQRLALYTIGARAWCVGRCMPCMAKDPHCQALDARLRPLEA